MNASTHPAANDPSVEFALSLAKDAIELRDFVVAAAIYTDLLEQALDADIRSDVEANLAVLLYMLAASKPGKSAALRQLRRAQSLLHEALRQRQTNNNPRKLTETRANLALVHIALHGATGDVGEILAAHLVLDSTQATLAEADDPALTAWVADIRNHLVGLRERRARRRSA